MNILKYNFLLVLVLVTAIVSGQTVTADFTYTNNCAVFEFTDGSSSTGGIITDWDWDFGDGETSTDQNPTHTYAVPATYTVTLTVTHENLSTDSDNMDVEFSDPVSSFTIEQLCGIVDFINTSTPMAEIDSVYYLFDDGSDTTLYIAPFDIEHEYLTEGIYNPEATAYKGGCFNTHTYPVNTTKPIASFIIDQFCDSVSFLNNSSPILELDSVYYYFDDGYDTTLYTAPFNIYHVYDDLDMVSPEMTVYKNNGCEETFSMDVDLAKPLTFFTSMQYCDSFIFINATLPFSAIDSIYWSFGDGGDSTITSMPYNVSHVYESEGIYPVELTVYKNNGCDSTFMKNINYSKPVGLFTFQQYCDSVVFQNNSQPMSQLDSVYWDFADGSDTMLYSSPFNITHVYDTEGLYEVNLVAYNMNCDSLFMDTVKYFHPEAAYTYVQYCDSIAFTNSSVPLDEIDSVLYNFDDGFTAMITEAPFDTNHVYAAEGMYYVDMTIFRNNGCSDTFLDSVSFFYPNASFIFEQFCDSVEFINTSLPAGDIDSVFWNFDDGNYLWILNPPFDITHTFNITGNFNVSLSVYSNGGCEGVFNDSIHIISSEVGFTYLSSASYLTQFWDASTPEGQIAEWFWDFGDLSTLEDTSSLKDPIPYQYQYEGFVNVKHTITDSSGCYHEIEKLVYIGTALIADFTYEALCFNDTVNFLDLSTSPAGAEPTSWHWDFGDGSDTLFLEPVDVVQHFYEVPGLYEVELVVTADLNGNAIIDTIVKYVNVSLPPEAMFDSVGVCRGEITQFYDLSTTYGDTITSWNWDFGDGITAYVKNPNHLYADTGTYIVHLRVETSNGCWDTISKKAFVSYAPVVNFQVENRCVNSPAQFYPVYDSTENIITQWYWDFDDDYDTSSSFEKYPTHTYSWIGEYEATMTASTYGCEKEVTKSFFVYSIPLANFTFLQDYGNVQGKVKFSNHSVDPTSIDLNYLWDFGNGNTSSLGSPTEVYEQDSTYIVNLIARNQYGCVDTSFAEINIFFKGLYFPTAFSPNNPNQDLSLFQPKGINLAEYNIQVYDLRGNLMWESDKVDEYGSPVDGWDGYYEGIMQPQGMYIWKASASFRDGTVWKGSTFQSENPQTQGTITLVR
jgi:PKD repeat protein